MSDLLNSELELQELENKLKDGWVEGKPYIFVSYASKNKLEVFKAILELRKKGINIYVDLELQQNISKDWLSNIKERLYDADCMGMVSFLSGAYLRSYACLIEQLIATSDDLNEEKGGLRQPFISKFCQREESFH